MSKRNADGRLQNSVLVLRKQAKLTRVELGKRIGCTPGPIGQLENNQYSPSLVIAYDISCVLGVDMEDLFVFDQEKELLTGEEPITRKVKTGKRISWFESSVHVERARYRMSQQELAEKAGVTRSTIIQLERNRYNPSLRLAHDIAAVFGVRIKDLFRFYEIEEMKQEA